MEQKLVVITGSTKGIGLALAERFAQGGYSVVLNARTPGAAEALAQQLQARHGTKAWGFTADLANAHGTTALAKFVRHLGIVPHILINNVGQFAASTLLSEEKGLADRMMQANFFSAYRLTRQLAPLMVARGSGHIVNICSIAPLAPKAMGGSYFVSKEALYGFTKVLREELRPTGVKVTAVLPSATYTPSWEGASIDPNRLMDPADVAEAIFAACQLSGRTVVEDLVLRPPLGDL